MRLKKDGLKSIRYLTDRKSSKISTSWVCLILIGAIIYTISPWDIIPDILGPFGMTDDIVLWAIIIGKGLDRLLSKNQNRNSNQ